MSCFLSFWCAYADPPPVFPIWGVKVQCKQQEYGIFDPPSGQTCGNYMSDFLKDNSGYINNPVSQTLPSRVHLSRDLGFPALIMVLFSLRRAVASIVLIHRGISTSKV